MKRFLLIFLSLILGLFTACNDDTNSTNNNCNPECKAYESCNNGNCELNTGMCASDLDCNDPLKPLCDANECIAQSTDCTPACNDTYQVCNNANCETKAGFCATNSDCTENEPICSAGHQCVAENNGDSVTLKELKDTGIEGNKYTTHGIVTAKDNDGFFMQDESDRGIYVYMNLSGGEFMAQEIGDKVTVTGMYKIYNGLNELTYQIGDNELEEINLDIRTDSSNNVLPEFKEIDAGIKTLENFESMLVKLKNPDFTIKKKLVDSGNRDFNIIDALGNTFTVNDYIFNLDSLKGDTLTKIQGVLKFHKDEYKIAPRVETDIEEKILSCDPACDTTYQVCVANGQTTVCELKEGMCEFQVDCEVNQLCDNHVCLNPVAVNLVPNGDLEDWTTNTEATGWIYEYDNQAGTTATKESSVVFEGSFAAKVKKTDSTENTSNKQNDFLSPAFPIDTTKEHHISVKLYDNDVNAKAKIYFVFYDETNHSNGMTKYTNFSSTNFDGWKEYTYPDGWSMYAGFTPEQMDTIRTMRVGIRLTDDEGTGTGYIYLDDVQVSEKLQK